MAGFQMPKRGDGAAMLRDLRDEERPPIEDASLEVVPDAAPSPDREQASNGYTPVLTEVRTYGSTEARQEASADASKEASTAGSKGVLADAGMQGRKPARKGTRTEAREPGSKESRTEGRAQAADGSPDILEVVEAALASREPLIGGVKATVDMSPELSTRSKRYLADHRGQNTRQVLIALFDAYLSAKGY